ncbi:division/cell wall cluster transcriptional repressor MraZ [Candidatus Shapirobacteria bacterium CG09_land_8_20_14_0_10_49_15]|uniref:Transcriptional regulator MraZ n=2 Tax=Candidatus Shapironibacteriota TaxID=1752721 RepID=A0A2M8L6I0_9BACT|nr:MAG: division/cell wall cluster transcriptional repressor MraZ [Candidatus Shapirobacteria bacterium CG09_land_8_20_14_0_10_49_15]PJE69831.1 MAG: division/cell wall cluster transcriptional repressor MraZ [Candidatus Shapirobacteria bacterium CG10_big_fil_rev_8_21_14_0_10_48_15]
MLLGEYQHHLTKGNRLALPSKIRTEIKGSELVLAKGFEPCVLGYEKATWEKTAQTELAKPVSEKEARQIRRQLFAGASQAEIDQQGRVVLPINLLSHAGVTSEMVIIGAGDHFEIWQKERWQKYYETISRNE